MSAAIHITGASGSGTSTLGQTLAAAIGAVPLDTDDFFWAPVEPKFSVTRAAPERLLLLEAAFDATGPGGWVLSGSLSGGWAAPIVPRFQHVIFLHAPTALRLARLRRREAEVFGPAAIAPGGSRHDEHEAFIRWAASYDAGAATDRSRRQHEAWLATLACPVLRLDGQLPVDALLRQALDWISPPR